MYFCRFFQAVLFLTGIPLTLYLLKKLIIYRYDYPPSHAAFQKNLTCWVGAISSHHLEIQSLGLEKNFLDAMFTVRESLFPNHKLKNWIPQDIYIYFPKILQS